MYTNYIISAIIFLVFHNIIFGSLNPFCIPRAIWIIIKYLWITALND